NAIHSFREGNGRTQRLFIEHLSFSRGYLIDFMNINNDEMLEASIKSFNGDYKMMEDLILKSIKQIKNN
ncbi:MAG: Fic family protein, partial [Elusimicrobiota bacterium]|nr:Fic family protein [Elusimicrobiota bacterium]